MSSTKKDDIKESTNKFKDSTDQYLEQQKQQIKDTTSNIADITNRVNENINEYQKTNNEILEKSTDTASKYQQQTINAIQSISNNYIELQKNFLNTFQSTFSKFLDDTNNNKSYWNNFMYPQRYINAYNKTNQNMTDNTVNATRRINDCVLGYTETVNKSIEIAQKYYNESVQNYFNFVNKIQKSYNQ